MFFVTWTGNSLPPFSHAAHRFGDSSLFRLPLLGDVVWYIGHRTLGRHRLSLLSPTESLDLLHTSIPMSEVVQVILLCDAMPFMFSLSDLILGQDLYTPKLFYALLVVILAYCVSFCVRSNIVNENGYAIPPGPLLRYAFLGKYPQRALQAWAKKYGPLFSLFVGNQLFIVISDPQIAHNLLVKNGKIFSSRKEYFIKAKTILHGRAVTSTPYGDTWQVYTLLDLHLCLDLS